MPSDQIKACIVFRDGSERATRLPEWVLDADELEVAAPAERGMRNVRVRYSHSTTRGVAVFKEVEGGG